MLKTKRWDEPVEGDDGVRILVTRYRPRGLSKAEETWDEWDRSLAPSEALLAAFRGKNGVGITWSEYTRAFNREMLSSKERIAELARRLAGGERITLLCSSSCTRERRCHRSLLRALIEKQIQAIEADPTKNA